VATFTDPDSGAMSAEYAATIDWAVSEAPLPTIKSSARRWPIPPLTRRSPTCKTGPAVLVGGTNIYLERLSDGKVATIPVPGSAPVLAQIDTAGLYYSYTVNDPKYPGRVTFLPTDQLPLN
jgi:hypothetical protein